MNGDEVASKALKMKKKVARKILLRFVLKFGGEETAASVRVILTRLDGFATVYSQPLLSSTILSQCQSLL